MKPGERSPGCGIRPVIFAPLCPHPVVAYPIKVTLAPLPEGQLMLSASNVLIMPKVTKPRSGDTPRLRHACLGFSRG